MSPEPATMTALDTDERAKVRGRRAGEALLAGFEDASEENRPSPPTNLEDQVVVPVRNIVPMSDQADPLQLSMIGN